MAALDAMRRARGTLRRNVGEGVIFEFRVADLCGAALITGDHVVHVAAL
jgi:hypothetical protein